MASDDPAIAAAFLELLLADRERGGVRELEAYQAEFVGFEDLVAREYALCTQTDPETVTDDAGGLFAIGPYRALKEIGRGGQGAVYLAEDRRLSRKVALKILAGFAADEHLARFRREAAVASRLDHPGICAVYESGTEDGRAFIAMRFVDGPSVADSIAEAHKEGSTSVAFDSSGRIRANDEAIVEFFEHAARALHAAHEAGIVHRDIKPGNLLKAPDGQPVLCDFGLAHDDATAEATLTQTGAVFGTPAYMSPEQLGGQRLDRRTDVWSLGVTLFESLTLRLPFEAPTREGLYHAIRQGAATDARQVRPELERDLAIVLATALEGDLDRRYGTALDLAEDLRRVRMREPIRARRASRALRLLRWAQRNPALATALVSLFTVLTLSLGLTAWFLQQAEGDKLELAALNQDLERALDDARTGRATKLEREVHGLVEAGYQALFSFPHTASDPSFERALELEPNHRAALIGLVWSSWKEPEVALERLERWASAALAEDPDVHWIRGLLEEAAGLDEAAADSFELAGDRDSHVRAWLRGLRAVRSFEPPTTPEEARRGLAEFRLAALRTPRPQFHYAHAQMMAAQLAGDRAALDDAAVTMEAHWGDSPFALEAIAQFYFALDPERAERALRRMLIVDPERVAPWLGVAQVEQRRGNHETALEHFDRALELDDSLGQTWLLRGMLLVELERWGEATRDLERAVELLPEYPTARTLLERARGELATKEP